MSLSLTPTLLPLGDQALLIRYADTLSNIANRAAIAAASHIAQTPPAGVEEVVPGLVSVMLRYGPGTDFQRLRGEVGLLLNGVGEDAPAARTHRIGVDFSGEDVGEVAAALGLTVEAFVAQHNASPVRVLATGFAPGFVYCGFHPAGLNLPRRSSVRPMVPAGTVLFAAGQTAIAATPIRTGWHVVGRTSFRNFDPSGKPPTRLAPGDAVIFEALV
ncbi:MAG TPA: carboxyltransferase domain-containing protein [Devosia sp.]|nr:carboxyltransferase domain-containing protein [Devosia sp.]